MRFHSLSQLLLATASVAAIGCASAQGDPGGRSDSANALIPEMEGVFSDIPGMIDHTHTVLGHALDIHGYEGGNLTVVKASAILHDIGIPRAREVHGSSNTRRSKAHPSPGKSSPGTGSLPTRSTISAELSRTTTAMRILGSSPPSSSRSSGTRIGC